MEPQTGRSLSPFQNNGITQVIRLHGVEYGKGSAVKLRWRVAYKVGGQLKQEQGEISELGVA
jgi:ADP-ribosylation factor-binding protein GGA